TKVESLGNGVDNFAEFLRASMPLMQRIRNSRNCIEHPRREHKLIVKDFSISSESALVRPMITIRHPSMPLFETTVSDFMETTCAGIVDIVELMVVFLCARSVKAIGAFPIQVGELPSTKDS